MTRGAFTAITRCAWAALLVASLYAGDLTQPPTFAREVAPIFQKNCQVCHRPGEIGPFSLLTYEQARPWAAAIKEAVKANKMPPWFADPRFGHFSNSTALTPSEINTIIAWAEAGAPKGDLKQMPPQPAFFEGWAIGKPDLVFELPKPYEVPATGVVDYQHVIVPTGFTKDTWVQAAEVRPTDRAVVHHIIAFIREPQSNWFKGRKPGEFFIAPQVKTEAEPDTSALPSDFLVGYAPGQPAEILRPGQAKLIKAGSDIIFQVHYTPNGKPVTDRTKLGLVLAKEPPKERVLTLSATNGTFKIPPGDPNYRVDASYEIGTHGEAFRPSSAHARSWQGFRVQGRLPHRRDPNTTQRSALQLALAELVHPRTTHPASGRKQNRVHRALRQLTQQPRQRRPHQGRDLGRAELGRDDGRLLQPGLRCGHAGRKDVLPKKPEKASIASR